MTAELEGPKKFVLDLLSAHPHKNVEVGALIDAANIFSISENRLRVTLSRMVGTGHLQKVQRGVYCLGPESEALSEEARRWRLSSQSMRSFRGKWLAVYTSDLGRSDRGKVAVRERALRLCGFREVRSGFFIRPDNLAGGMEAAHNRLLVLGLDEGALVLSLSTFAMGSEQGRSLWKIDEQEQRVAAQVRALQESSRRLDKLCATEAAKESFLLGREAIATIVRDPLLPRELAGDYSIHPLVEAMKSYDEKGQAVWADVLRGKMAA